MKMIRQFVAVALGLYLVPAPLSASSIVLGVVTRSEGAHIGEIDLSEGTTIYDGDRLSTEEEGSLSLHARRANLQLDAESSVTVRQASGGGIAAELTAGTLVFSAARIMDFELHVDGAQVRPATNMPTTAHIRLVGPQELRIFSRRSALEFSYREQSVLIPENTAYRVMLDPVEDSEAAPGKSAAWHQPTFLLVAIGAGAVAAAATHMPGKKKHHESPSVP